MIILMGSVGSGKTEQSRRLSHRLNCPRISTSQLLRASRNPVHQTDIAAGRLVSDQDVIELLQPVIDEIASATSEFILDGAPRSVIQAQWLEDQIRSGRISLTGIVNLKVSDTTVLERLRQRGRSDDSESIILKRLRDYHDITSPVIAYLEKAGFEIKQVNGELPPDQVETQIKEVLKI